MIKKLPVLDIEGPPLADPRQWQLKVGGLVENPSAFSIREIGDMGPTEATMPLTCVGGRDMRVPWKGVRPVPEARWLAFCSYSEYTGSLSRGDALDDRTMLVYGRGGGDLPAENGGPLRLVVPFRLACKPFVEAKERGYPPEAGTPADKREEYGL